jgi:hypothetical protein
METIEVGKLSPAQLAKLRNKKNVRISKGVGTKIKLGASNAKKVLKKLKIGKGVNLTMDEDEIFENAEMNGGALGKIGKRFRKGVKNASKGAKSIASAGANDAKDATRRIKKMTKDPKEVKNFTIDVVADGAMPFTPKTKEAVKKQAKKSTGGNIASTMRKLGKTAKTIGKRPIVRNSLVSALKSGVSKTLDAVESAVESAAPPLAPFISEEISSAKGSINKRIDKGFKPKGKDVNVMKEIKRTASKGLNDFSLEALTEELRKRAGMTGQGVQLGGGVKLGGGVRLNGGAVKLGNNLVGGNMVGLPSSIYGHHFSRLMPSQIDQKQYTV